MDELHIYAMGRGRYPTADRAEKDQVIIAVCRGETEPLATDVFVPHPADETMGHPEGAAWVGLNCHHDLDNLRVYYWILAGEKPISTIMRSRIDLLLGTDQEEVVAEGRVPAIRDACLMVLFDIARIRLAELEQQPPPGWTTAEIRELYAASMVEQTSAARAFRSRVEEDRAVRWFEKMQTLRTILPRKASEDP